MFPVATFNDIMNALPTDTKNIPQVTLCFSFFMSPANLYNLFGGENCIGMLLAVTHSALCVAILIVVLLSPKKKVFVVVAPPHIASVKNPKSIWDRTVPQFPRKTMEQP